MLEDQIKQLHALPPEDPPQKGKIRVKLISPMREVFSMEVDKVLLPAVDGDILILPDRAPIFMLLKAGRMVIYNAGQKPLSYMISMGICEVRRDLCPVLAWGVKEEDVDPEKIAIQLYEAEKLLPTTYSSNKLKELTGRIDFYKTTLKTLSYEYDTAVIEKLLKTQQKKK